MLLVIHSVLSWTLAPYIFLNYSFNQNKLISMFSMWYIGIIEKSENFLFFLINIFLSRKKSGPREILNTCCSSLLLLPFLELHVFPGILVWVVCRDETLGGWIISFMEKKQAVHLQGKPCSFHLDLELRESVTNLPRLTQDYGKTWVYHYQAGKQWAPSATSSGCQMAWSFV